MRSQVHDQLTPVEDTLPVPSPLAPRARGVWGGCSGVPCYTIQTELDQDSPRRLLCRVFSSKDALVRMEYYEYKCQQNLKIET
ncbi:hypothetical protein PLAN_40419 [Planktothrix rubescens CCAP 1459/22]|uniref:Uncharacterized protein n=1 Tax=Planktothrix rubescens CCAP 1459/22 TaxID=329571 RepID=A0A6J7ZPJ4_PLARU|nr:hypothetical protein PLAN_40419 [Planktothrix rubescens NIVA-CYA 18]CAD0226908.1 hypothetical protein PL10110_300020 [Planktothrix agardhii]